MPKRSTEAELSLGKPREQGADKNKSAEVEEKKEIPESCADLSPGAIIISMQGGIDSFEIICLIGRGDVGRVYLVKHIQTGKPFAMKVMSKQDVIKRKKIRRCVEEREILNSTSHPFIVTLYFSFQTKDHLIFILDYCGGGEFSAELPDRPKTLSELATRFYAAEVLLALEYLHMKDIIYRDLKPENILLHQSGHIMLADFNLSKKSLQRKEPKISRGYFSSEESSKIDVRPNLITNSFVGTEEYVAPEVLRGRSYSSTVDWWSFGVLLYKMLFGVTPFRGYDQNDTFGNILFGKWNFPDPANISPELKDLLKRLITSDPKKRLGAKHGAADIKAHAFFKSFKWPLILNKNPPIKPEMKDKFDTRNFSPQDDEKDFSDIEELSSEEIKSSAMFSQFTTIKREPSNFVFPEWKEDKPENEALVSTSMPLLRLHSPENEKISAEVQEFLQDDAEKLLYSFKNAYEKVYAKMKRPHVLIAGTTGAGKSSIINSVFGSDIAQEGAGRPITQHFTKYCPEQQSIVLFDSQGLEAGMQFDEFLESTLEFFSNNESDIGANHLPKEYQIDATGLEKRVHLVWYVVNAASARFQDFEERICRELFGRLPVIFILNKCDIATRDQLDKLTETLKAMKLPNCIGILECATSKFVKPVAPDCCPKCQSTEDMIVYNRTKIAICQLCGTETPFSVPPSLKMVLKVTFEALPSIAKEAFVAAQQLSFKLKDYQAREIILEFYDEKNIAFTAHRLLHLIAKMLTRLSVVWNFQEHGSFCAENIAKGMMGHISVRDRIFLFVQKNKLRKYRATAIGIIWNHSVRELAKIVLAEAAESVSKSTIEENWHLILEDCFHGLNEEEVDHLEERLKDASLENILDEDTLVFKTKYTNQWNVPITTK